MVRRFGHPARGFIYYTPMEINTALLRVAKESLKYSIMYVDNLDYHSKYGLTHDEAYKLRRDKLNELRDAKNHLSEIIKHTKTKKL